MQSEPHIGLIAGGIIVLLGGIFGWKLRSRGVPFSQETQRLISLIAGPVLIVMGVIGEQSSIDIEVPPQLDNVHKVKQINQYELADQILNEDETLSKLAWKNQYTVVEVWVDGDEKCRQIEKQFKPFLNKRKDVVIQRVHHRLNSLPHNYAVITNLDYVPHIEIYGPDKKLIKADGKNKRDGTRFLMAWMKYERTH